MARLALPGHRSISRSRAATESVDSPAFRLGTLASWVGAAFVLGTGAFSLYLTQMSSVATGGYDLERLQAERIGWIARNEQLEFELAKRQSLAWTETQAVQRLGMVKSGPPVFVIVDITSTREASHSMPPDQQRPTTDVTFEDHPIPGNGGSISEWLGRISAWLTTAGILGR